MNDFEHQLRSAPLAPPSSDLDDRIAAILGEVPSQSRAARSISGWPWWIAATIALVGAAALVFISVRRGSTPLDSTRSAIYQIAPRGPMRSFLLESPTAASDSPRVIVRVSSSRAK